MLTSPREFKGVGEFMALAAALRSRSDITLSLVLNAEIEEATAFIRQHPEAMNVTIYPRTDDPASYYERAALVVNLTRVDLCAETFGLTLVEAMTFGIPVIAPPIGGPAEIVTHGVEGYCIDSRNTDALRDAVITLADEPDTYAAMTHAAKRRAQDFTFEAYTKAMHAALRDTNEREIR